VLQCVEVRCGALQCVAVRCSELAAYSHGLSAVITSRFCYVTVRCSALQCVAVCWQYIHIVYPQEIRTDMSVLQCIVVCCNVLAVCSHGLFAVITNRYF